MGEIVFYTNPQSRGQIIRWMLEEIGQPYETVALEWGAKLKSSDYLAINPMGKVPAIRHNGKVVTEAAAICTYLADAFPQAGLAPPPDQRADYYRWLFFAAGPWETAIIDKFRKIEVLPEQQALVGYGCWDHVVRAVQSAISTNEWIAGDKFSAADLYLSSQIGWPLHFNIVEVPPDVAAYVERAHDRDAYRRATAKDEALTVEMKSNSG